MKLFQSDPWQPPVVRRRTTKAGSAPRGLAPGILSLVLILGAVWFGPSLVLNLVTTADGSGPTPSPSAPASSTEVPPPPPEASPPATSDTPVEGQDYAFLFTDGSGDPLGWACTAPITFALHGPAPDGAQAALEQAIGQLKNATGLPLSVSAPDTPVTVPIHYVPASATVDGLTLPETSLGVARPTLLGDNIVDGIILLRSDHDQADPANHKGQQVTLHEAAHVLGLDHATPGAGQIMEPAATDLPPHLHDGDLAGLAQLGC